MLWPTLIRRQKELRLLLGLIPRFSLKIQALSVSMLEDIMKPAKSQKLTFLDSLAYYFSGRLPKGLQTFTWDRFGEINFNYLKSCFVTVELFQV